MKWFTILKFTILKFTILKFTILKFSILKFTITKVYNNNSTFRRRLVQRPHQNLYLHPSG